MFTMNTLRMLILHIALIVLNKCFSSYLHKLGLLQNIIGTQRFTIVVFEISCCGAGGAEGCGAGWARMFCVDPCAPLAADI